MTDAELKAALAEADVWQGTAQWAPNIRVRLALCPKCDHIVEEGDIYHEHADGRSLGRRGACGRCAGYRTD